MFGRSVFKDDYGYECYVDQEIHNTKMSASSSDDLEPPTYFRMALVKCISVYIREFCRHREINPAGIEIDVHFVSDKFSVKEIDTIRISVSLPESFPQKYKRAIDTLISQCRIIDLLADPPDVIWELADLPVVDMHFNEGVGVHVETKKQETPSDALTQTIGRS